MFSCETIRRNVVKMLKLLTVCPANLRCQLCGTPNMPNHRRPQLARIHIVNLMNSFNEFSGYDRFMNINFFNRRGEVACFMDMGPLNAREEVI